MVFRKKNDFISIPTGPWHAENSHLCYVVLIYILILGLNQIKMYLKAFHTVEHMRCINVLSRFELFCMNPVTFNQGCSRLHRDYAAIAIYDKLWWWFNAKSMAYNISQNFLIWRPKIHLYFTTLCYQSILGSGLNRQNQLKKALKAIHNTVFRRTINLVSCD